MSKRDIEAIYPLSPQQTGMLLESLAVPGSGIHVEQVAATLEGDLDVGLFTEAWQRLVQRHPVLRTAFVWQDQEEPLQLVLRRVEVPLEREDWSDVPDEETPARLAAFLEADGRRDFKPSKAPLMRVHLLCAGPRLHHLVWTHHHILMDGWCRPLVLHELVETYAALAAGREPRLAPTRPYRDFVKWLGERDPVASEAFWRESLAGFTHPTPLGRPASDGTPRVGGHGGVKLRFGPEETRVLESVARARHLTASTLAQGAWALALAWASGENEVVFGVTVSGRPEELDGIEGSIGLFINTLPLRVEVPPGEGLLPWLESLQRKNLELRRHEHVSAGQIHQWSEVPGSLPLFESLLVFENYPADPAEGDGDRPELPLRIRRTSAAGGRTRHPITLMVVPGERLAISLVHDRARVPRAAAEALAGAFADLLRAIVEESDRDLASLLGRLEGKAPPELPAGDRGEREARPVAAPRSSTEQMLAVLWGEVLGLRPVGIDEDFFRLGGHSMAAAELIAVVRRAFDLELPLRTLFEHPTIEELAAEIARRK
ncbi:MAG TPA: condensation domain-containing protein, partial [Thermoanaerobaculia bacterium]|nr:condensation domain-containing protein [Thermoanaerobaculia bacterium]